MQIAASPISPSSKKAAVKRPRELHSVRLDVQEKKSTKVQRKLQHSSPLSERRPTLTEAHSP
jgi:hypothetical protein